MLTFRNFPSPDPDARPAREARGGFTLVEVVIALILLSVAVLGMGVTASRMATTAVRAEWSALALEAAEDRLVEVRLDPRYEKLDSLFAGTETNIIGPNSSRVTGVQHMTGGNPAVDYKIITVEVSADQFETHVSRRIIIAAP